MKKTQIKIIILFLLLPALALSAEQDAIDFLKKQGIQVKREFKVNNNIKGMLVEQDSSQMILYATNDGKYLINGVITDANGKNITSIHQRQFLKMPSWRELQNTSHITELPLNKELINAYKVFVFFDPYCPHSRVLWQELQKYREIGLTIGWIPIAYLRPESRNIATHLLSTNDRAEELAKLMTNKLGNISVSSTKLDEYKIRLKYNLKIMQDFGSQSTPTIIWKKRGQVQAVHRLPYISELEKITGLNLISNAALEEKQQSK